MFLSLMYEIYLIGFGLRYVPFFFHEFFFKKKYRKNFFQLFGRGFPLIKKQGKPLIWIHADSLGEVRAVVALIKALKTAFDQAILICSVRTETGFAEASLKAAADYVVYLPVDFGWIIKPIIRRTAPDMVIISEEDFWYNFISTSKQLDAIIAIVNGKLTGESLEFKFYTKAMFDCFDLCCVQSPRYAQCFKSMNVPAEKIFVTGNMKLDNQYVRLSKVELDAWRQELGIAPNDPVIIIGSSHHPEETQLLDVMANVWNRYPQLKLIIVPRHPHRFNEVAEMLQKRNIRFQRISQKKNAEKVQPTSVILIDAMGLLPKYYQLADIAIVAGSFIDKIGGHNILEPTWFGVPSIFGPYMYAQPDLVELIKDYGAGLQVTMEELPTVLIDLLANPAHREKIIEASLKLCEAEQGATYRTIEKLCDTRPSVKIMNHA